MSKITKTIAFEVTGTEKQIQGVALRVMALVPRVLADTEADA